MNQQFRILNTVKTVSISIFCFSFIHSANAQTNSPSKKETVEKESDKIDIQKLEQKYWSAKDTDFNVVQNRTYTKEKRFNLSAAFGLPINDPVYEGHVNSFMTSYYWNERMGVELNYTVSQFKTNDAFNNFVNDHSVYPNHNTFLNSKILNYSWTPFYAKMSFLDKKIIYFDMALGFGLGTTEYRQNSNAGEKTKSALTKAFTITQHFFFSQHFSFRMDYVNKWTNEEKLRYQIKANETEDDRSLGTKSVNDSSLTFGLTYWY
ncbi:MAG: outer membrane beta-barrel domain-containing protein [Pseudobdellovibrionaceae bacterium]